MGRLALDLSGTPCLLDLRAFTARWASRRHLALTLSPWTYRRHMDTLRVTTTPPAPICGWTLAASPLPCWRAPTCRRSRPRSNPSPCGGPPAATTPCPPPAEGEWLDLGPAGPRPPAPVERTPALQRPLRRPRG
jgi:hypothetical protein